MELCWLAVAKGPGVPSHMSPLALTAGHSPGRGGTDVVDVMALLEELQQRFFKQRGRILKKRGSKYLW